MRRIDQSEERLLRVVLIFMCGWEFLAMTTRVVPTVSSTVWYLRKRFPRTGRVFLVSLWGGVVVKGTSHFFIDGVA